MDKLVASKKNINGFEIAPYSAGPKFRNGDTLLAKITPCLENGKTAQVQILEKNEVAFGSSEFIVLRENEYSKNDFIYYLAKSPSFRKKAIICMEGTSGRKRVNEGALKLQELPIPPILIQQKIAAVLSALDSKIELNNRINSELEAMAKNLYDYWFVQFDFPNENGKPYKTSGGKMVWSEELKRDIPEGWKTGNLLDIAEYTNGLPCQNYPPSGENTLKVIKIKEMHDGFSRETDLVRSDIPQKVIIEDGDVLFSWSASLEIQLWSRGKGALNQHIFKVTSKDYPRSFYYYQLLNYIKHFKMMAENRKTTMGHITQDHLEQSRIVLPLKSLTLELEKIIDPILNSKIHNDLENNKLSELRDWLLPMLMNGQVKVM
jgi:type I restriction enzyme S subunit